MRAAAAALVAPWFGRFGGERLSDVSCSCERESGCFAGKLMGKGEASAAGERVAGMTREAREVR